MGFISWLYGRPQASPRTLQEYLGADRTGRAARAFSRQASYDQGEIIGMGEVPVVNDEARGYAFVLDLIHRLPGDRVSEILDKMVAHSQTLRRGGN